MNTNLIEINHYMLDKDVMMEHPVPDSYHQGNEASKTTFGSDYEAFLQLKEVVIADLRKKVTTYRIQDGDRMLSMSELATAIEANETVGIRVLNDYLNLTIDLVARQKEKLP
jgi:hypothetical protein